MRPRLAPLSVKLLRDLWRLRAQALAIAAVTAAGVGMVVMSFGMIRSLESSRSAYYAQYRFAEVFAPVRRAPEPVLARLRRSPGLSYPKLPDRFRPSSDAAKVAERFWLVACYRLFRIVILKCRICSREVH